MAEKEVGTLEGIFWIGIGSVICILSWRFDLGSFVEPGPGFIAFMSGLFISGVGLFMALSRIFSKSPSHGSPDAAFPILTASWPRLAYTLGLLFGYTLFFDALGYVVATFLLMWSLSYNWETRNWVSSLLFSLMTVIISYVMFEVWLRCQLPRGIFPWW